MQPVTYSGVRCISFRTQFCIPRRSRTSSWLPNPTPNPLESLVLCRGINNAHYMPCVSLFPHLTRFNFYTRIWLKYESSFHMKWDKETLEISSIGPFWPHSESLDSCLADLLMCWIWSSTPVRFNNPQASISIKYWQVNVPLLFIPLLEFATSSCFDTVWQSHYNRRQSAKFGLTFVFRSFENVECGWLLPSAG